MPQLSYDRHSLLVDDQRLWLVAGAIHYPRVPRELWRDRIRAARQSGLNCIETYVFWNAHEPEPGRFDFAGDLDLRHFVELVAEEGMWCILRPGPFICAEWDQGALPAWLRRAHRSEDTADPEPIRLRQDDPRFVSACDRFMGAVLDQVRDLQASDPAADPSRPAVLDVPPPGGAACGFGGGAAGPIVITQVENEWFCTDPNQHDTYLQPLAEILRKHGCTTLLNNCNNLWQSIDGTLDTWNGAKLLTKDLRQLAAARPDAPRIVTEFWPGWFDAWGQPHAVRDAQLTHYRLAGILAAAAMPNLYMFFGGSNFGFFGGRTVDDPAMFMTQSYDYDAPLNEHGGVTDKLRLLRPLLMFASHFHKLFSHADPTFNPTCLHPREDDHAPAVLEVRGDSGSATFIFRDPEDRREQLELLLPNGDLLDVTCTTKTHSQWIVTGVPLTPNHFLDHTNASPFAFVGERMLACFGVAGSTTVFKVNGECHLWEIPTGDSPRIEQVDGLTIVMLSEEQACTTLVHEPGLWLGVDGFGDSGEPIASPGHTTLYRIDPDGKIDTVDIAKPSNPTAPALSDWQSANVDAWTDGESVDYRPIAGPQTLEDLGCDFGYGWYRIALNQSDPHEPLLAPAAGDRLHLFIDGTPRAVIGRGPGATDEPLETKLRGQTLVVLADNLGRLNYGQYVGMDIKGLGEHIYPVRRRALPDVAAETTDAVSPFTLQGYVVYERQPESAVGTTLNLQLTDVGAPGIIIEFRDLPANGVLLIEGKPHILLAHGTDNIGPVRVLLRPGIELPSEGSAQITLSLRGDWPADTPCDRHLKLYDCDSPLTGGGAAWSFAPWAMPADDAFGPPQDHAPGDKPAWFRATFPVIPGPMSPNALYLELEGLTKGQAYFNGHNLGRYFIATHEGQAVPPQTRIYLPEVWLRPDAPNVVTLFDEHGRQPDKVCLSYRRVGPYEKSNPSE